MGTSLGLRAQLLDAVLRGGTYVGPQAVYVALFVQLLVGGRVEAQDQNYARRPVTFSPPRLGATWNVDPVEFAQAGRGYGVVVEFALFDAPQGGNELYRAELDEPQVVPEGSVVEFPAGALKVEWPS